MADDHLLRLSSREADGDGAEAVAARAANLGSRPPPSLNIATRAHSERRVPPFIAPVSGGAAATVTNSQIKNHRRGAVFGVLTELHSDPREVERGPVSTFIINTRI